MRRLFVALALAVVLPLPSLAAEITVKEGETLSDIAERHHVSVSTLMKLNRISDPDQLSVGQRLTLPGGAKPGGTSPSRSGAGRVTVQEGETLSEIAEREGVSLGKLIALNGITDPDHVAVGTSLIVGGSAKTTNGSATPSAFTYNRGASEHVVRSGESLSGIAEGYGLPLSRLVALNQISDPNVVDVGTRLRLKGTTPAPRSTATATETAPEATVAPIAKPKPQPRPVISSTTPASAATSASTNPNPRPSPTKVATPIASASSPATGGGKPDWRSYGPLQVDWANWQPMGGSLVAPTLNAQGQSLYLAINCTARKLNATSATGQWKTWDDPQADFELQMVNDLCKRPSS
jgi:LysM repeat protein